MKHTDLSLVYNYREPVTILERNPLLILIHGYGSNEDDLFYFSSTLAKEFHIVSIRGVKNLSFGDNTFSWFDINFDSQTSEKFVDVEQAIESRNKIKVFIEEISKKYNVNTDNVSLMGFSQGAILSFAISLTFPKLIKNVIPMSGYLHKGMIDFQPKEEYSHLNFFITHGSMDEVVIPKYGRLSADILKENSINFEYKEYPMVHTISPPAFSDINNFILSILLV